MRAGNGCGAHDGQGGHRAEPEIRIWQMKRRLHSTASGPWNEVSLYIPCGAAKLRPCPEGMYYGVPCGYNFRANIRINAFFACCMRELPSGYIRRLPAAEATVSGCWDRWFPEQRYLYYRRPDLCQELQDQPELPVCNPDRKCRRLYIFHLCSCEQAMG